METKMAAIPEEFKEAIKTQFGEEDGSELLSSLEETPSVSLRLNRRKTGAGSGTASAKEKPYADMREVPWAEGGYWLSERPRFTNHPWLHGGGFYVQEAASMFISTLVKEVVAGEGGRPLKVLDLCGAPGGKSIGSLESLPDGSVLVSNEVTPSRTGALKENMTKWGFPGSIVTSGPASAFGKMTGYFDLVIVDAPCSGEGMMRKEAVARTQWSEHLVEQCAALQREILEDVMPALKSGGWLVYSTCTFNRKENEENVEWLVKTLGLKPEGKARRFTPHRDSTEGLFMALLRKPAGEEIASCGDKKANKKVKKGEEKRMDAAVKSAALKWLKKGEWDITEHNGMLLGRIPGVSETIAALPDGIRVLKSGVEIGEIKGRDLVPAHGLALSTAMAAGAFPEVELTFEDALRYLSRESPMLPADSPRGYIAVNYKGVRLGFVKNLGSRANNLYPKEWKIRTLQGI